MKDSARRHGTAPESIQSCTRSSVLLCALVILAFTAFPGTLAAQTGARFVPGCAYPFANIAHPIDSDCGVLGKSGTDASNQAQNRAKNNFCAAGDPIPVTAESLVELQKAVDTAGILYGDAFHLPPDRSRLQNLLTSGSGKIGEGAKVRLVALVENAHYSDVPNAQDKAKGKGGESVNCNELLEETNDIHIPLVQTANADECTSVTAEISPHGRPAGWTPAALNKAGQVLRITGQLFFDGSHRPCTAGHPENPKRSSLWEIHPVYAIDVCTGSTIADCPAGDESKWHPLQASAAVSPADTGKPEKESGGNTTHQTTTNPETAVSSKQPCKSPGTSGGWGLLAVLALLILFLVLGAKSDILRDIGPQPPAERQPFSLGRCQMAFWFFIIMGSFIWIAIVKGEAPALTSQALALMGIAAGTSLGAVAVDSTKDSQRRTAESAVQGATTHIEQLDQQLAAVTPGSQEALNLAAQRADAAARHAVATRRQAALSSASPPASRGFLSDILADNDGVSFHRFQIMSWTIVLGIYFVAKVGCALEMPTLDNSLLTLMGVSSGTYLGFKFPEPPKSK